MPTRSSIFDLPRRPSPLLEACSEAPSLKRRTMSLSRRSGIPRPDLRAACSGTQFGAARYEQIADLCVLLKLLCKGVVELDSGNLNTSAAESRSWQSDLGKPWDSDEPVEES